MSICLRKMPVDPAFDRQAFANKLHGLSGADIAFIAREAAYNCLRRSIDIHRVIREEVDSPLDMTKLVVTDHDFETALETVLLGTHSAAANSPWGGTAGTHSEPKPTRT